MHIKSCYVPKDESHITRYQELQHFKHTRRSVLLDYLVNIKAYIASLHNKSSSAIKYTISRSSKSITSSNDTNSSEISGFTSVSSMTTESNCRSFSYGSLVFGIDAELKPEISDELV